MIRGYVNVINSEQWAMSTIETHLDLLLPPIWLIHEIFSSKMAIKSSFCFEGELIEKFEYLLWIWDTSRHDYRDRIKQDNSWITIGNLLRIHFLTFVWVRYILWVRQLDRRASVVQILTVNRWPEINKLVCVHRFLNAWKQRISAITPGHVFQFKALLSLPVSAPSPVISPGWRKLCFGDCGLGWPLHRL